MNQRVKGNIVKGRLSSEYFAHCQEAAKYGITRLQELNSLTGIVPIVVGSEESTKADDFKSYQS